MLGGEEGLEYREEREREHCCLLNQTECLCPGMSRWWIWLALGWHRHIRRKARTPQRSPLSLLFLALFECLLPIFSPLAQHTHRAVLISTTCPHLSACGDGSNMGPVCSRVQGVWINCTIKEKSVSFCSSKGPSLCK